MKIKFCGAAKYVTGSCHLLTLSDGTTILLDCGLYQGKGRHIWDWNNEWQFDPKTIDHLVLSHAHIDHSGRVPKLVQDGFQGNIYSTHATRSLCNIMLLDSAKIQERDVEYYNKRLLKKRKKRRKNKKLRVPLYRSDIIPTTMERFITIGYDRWLTIDDQVDVLFRDSGHILGSASVTLKIKENGKETMFGFTGDIGRPDRPILRDPKPMPAVHYLIAESTYGDKLHEAKPEQEGHFLEVIKNTCVDKKGKLLIPAFSVGRTQEIVYMLDKLAHDRKLPRIPVYVDSPLAVNATAVFGSHPECFDLQLLEYMLLDDDPFGFNSLHYIKEVQDSKDLNNTSDPAIIISASGMMNAGRVRHHLFNTIDNPRNTVLIVGYCSPDTPGGMLRDGVQAIKLFGEWKMVRAQVEVMDSFSAHGDYQEMIEYLSNQRKSIKELFLVHGEEKTQEIYKQKLLDAGFHSVHIPDLGQEFDLN